MSQIELGLEKWDDVWWEAQPMMEQHKMLLADNEPLLPDHAMIRHLEGLGGVMIVTARERAELVGYSIFYITPSLETKGLLVGMQGPWFAASAGAGLRMLRMGIDELASRGIRKVLLHRYTAGDPRVADLLLRLGAREVERVYELEIGD